MPSRRTFNYSIKLVGADFISLTQHSHNDGSRSWLTLFGYYNSTHLNISKFATNFKNINILESGRPASKLDITHLKNWPQSSSPWRSISKASLPWESRTRLSSLSFQSHQFPLPWPFNDMHPRVTLLSDWSPIKMVGALAAASNWLYPKEKGLSILNYLRDSNTFPHTSTVCPGFVCQGQYCTLHRGNCIKKHLFKSDPSNMALIKEVGGHFLSTDKGWFCKHSPRGVLMSNKYKKLFGYNNSTFGW